jgi:AbrB family looped-hinge helix DNA binding protein
MSKVTSKYQVTMPKKIAESYGIRPGDEIDWVAAGDVIRVIPPGTRTAGLDLASRLRVFDQATERQRKRPVTPSQEQIEDRGWSREDLYGRGRSD